MRLHPALGALIALALTATACTSDDRPDQGDPAETPSSVHVDDDHIHPSDPQSSAEPDPERDPADQVQAARRVLATWARPDLDYDTWWTDLKPLLNGSGQQAYAYTDPTVLPALRIRGEGDLVRPGQDLARVNFRTNHGTWGVLVVRGPGGDSWLGERIYFPKSGDWS